MQKGTAFLFVPLCGGSPVNYFGLFSSQKTDNPEGIKQRFRGYLNYQLICQMARTKYASSIQNGLSEGSPLFC
jgi:hypothetical protein